MSQEEIPAEPNDDEQIWDVIKQRLAGSVLDQITALREEALGTANTALQLAADAELRAASSDTDVNIRVDNLASSLDKVIALQQQLFHTSFARYYIQSRWSIVASLSAMFHAAAVDHRKHNPHEIVELFQSTSNRFIALMDQSLLVPDAETAESLSEQANTLAEEYRKRVLDLYRLPNQQSQV